MSPSLYTRTVPRVRAARLRAAWMHRSPYNHILMRKWNLVLALLLVTGSSASPLVAQSGPNDAMAREIYKELIEINTTDTPAGNVTKAAEAMAARLKGSGKKRPFLLLAHLDVVEAKREDWSVVPFTFLEKDGYFLWPWHVRRQGDGRALCRQSHPPQA